MFSIDYDYWVALFAEYVLSAADTVAPYAGFTLGFALMCYLSAPEDRERMQMFWGGVAATAAAVGPVAWFGLPHALGFIAQIDVSMPLWHLAFHGGGAVAGVFVYLGWMRWGQPYVNRVSHGLTRRTNLERNRRTDVREIGKHLPDAQTDFDPARFVASDPRKKGVFVGRNEHGKPVYVPYDLWRKSHVQVIGTTGAGKGVASAVLMGQALRAGEAVFVLDPKDDEWAPHVLKAEAERAGVPFHLVNLRDDVPQIDMLADMLPEQLEELFISAFSLAEKGEAADFYRIGDRKAAASIAGLVAEGFRDLREIALDPRTRSVHDSAAGFLGKLEELAQLTAINAPGGLDLMDVIRDGGCVYVIGSMRNSRVIMAQRMLFVRLLQLVETRDRVAGDVRPVCVFLDEVKYHLSRPALEGLGAARDKGMHLILAHQSLGDLRDCPADLDPEAVVGAVVENCGLRVAYRVRNPETAEWLAQMSGEILVDDEARRVERNAAGSELMGHERTVRQAARYLVDQNMLLNLPDRTAVLYGSGLPQFAHICPIRAEKRPLITYHAPVIEEEPPKAAQEPLGEVFDSTQVNVLPEPKKAESGQSEAPAKPKKDFAASLIDLGDCDVDI